MLATATPPASTTRSPPPSAPTESFPAARRRKAPRTRSIVVLGRWRSPIASQAMGHVEVLLKVVPERDVDKRTAIRDQLHGRRQPALHYRQVATRQGLEQVVHVASCLHAIHGWKVVGVDTRSADQQQLCLRNLGAKNAKRLDDAVQEMDTYRRSSHRGDDQ